MLNEFDLTFRGHDGDEAGNAIDDEAKTPFTLAQGCLRAFPIFNISQQVVPANGSTFSVTLRDAA